MSEETKKVLEKLEEVIKDQIAAEYPDEETRQYVFNNLTVPDLLRMLSYTFSN